MSGTTGLRPETTPSLVHGARELARHLLGPASDRWRHTVAVAARAKELARTMPAADRDLLAAGAERVRDRLGHRPERTHQPRSSNSS